MAPPAWGGRGARWLVGVAAGTSSLALGLVLATMVVAVHGRWWSLMLAAATTLAVVLALPAGVARIGLAAGLAVGVGLATRTRPEGDYLVAADARGYLLEALVVVVVVGALVTLPGPRRSRLRDGPPPTP